MDCQVGTVKFIFLVKADPHAFAQDPIDNKTAGQGKHNGEKAPPQLGKETDSPHSPQKLLPENAGRNPPPGADYAMQRPYSQDIVDFKFLLLKMEAVDKDYRGDTANSECPQRVHDVTTGADRNEPG